MKVEEGLKRLNRIEKAHLLDNEELTIYIVKNDEKHILCSVPIHNQLQQFPARR